MNTMLNISAFVRVARLGSISAAARELHAVTSVVAKRISQLEEEGGASLITRTSRGVSLTAAGDQYLPQPPKHPTDLVNHPCLSTSLLRSAWTFTHARGAMTVEV